MKRAKTTARGGGPCGPTAFPKMRRTIAMTKDEVKAAKEAARQEISRLTEAIWQDGGVASSEDATWEQVSLVAMRAQDLEAACVAWQEADEASLIENPGRIVDLGGGKFKKVSK
jgi:hypothetical protein